MKLEAAGVKKTSLPAVVSGSRTSGGAAVSGDGNAIADQFFFPLSYNEVLQITGNNNGTDKRAFPYSWWLRSPGEDPYSQNPNRASIVFNYGYVDPNGLGIDFNYLLARPAMQITLDSFLSPKLAKAVSSDEQLTLGNRKWDVIGANAAVTPAFKWDGTDGAQGTNPFPVMGDPGTVTALYSAENVEASDVAANSDKDSQDSLKTPFNLNQRSCPTDLGGSTGNGTNSNAYVNSCLQDKLAKMYETATTPGFEKWGSVAKGKVVARSLPTQAENASAAGGEAYGDGNAITGQALFPLSTLETAQM